jgi:hypothetical protein
MRLPLALKNMRTVDTCGGWRFFTWPTRQNIGQRSDSSLCFLETLYETPELQDYFSSSRSRAKSIHESTGQSSALSYTPAISMHRARLNGVSSCTSSSSVLSSGLTGSCIAGHPQSHKWDDGPLPAGTTDMFHMLHKVVRNQRDLARKCLV